MAWWITVYCRRDCSALSAADLARGLRDRDPDAPAGVDDETLAEDYGLTRASAEQALPHLVVTDHLEACRAVVAIELGYSMRENMCVDFAYDGAFVVDDRRWQRIESGAYTRLA